MPMIRLETVENHVDLKPHPHAPRLLPAAQLLQKWSQNEDSPALQDVLHMVYELNLMWTEAQRDFIGQFKA